MGHYTVRRETNMQWSGITDFRVPGQPDTTNAYVTEDSTQSNPTFYVAEDGVTYYVQES